MSLAVFETFLVFAERAMQSKPNFPDELDPVELASAFASYGVVLLHSQMEQCVKTAVSVRCAKCVDPEVRSFAQSIIAEKTGKLGLQYLNQTLNRFGAQCKIVFRTELDATGLNASWDSVVNHRHIVAHEGKPAALTLGDLRLYFEGVRKILGFYCKALGLSVVETNGISPLIIF